MIFSSYYAFILELEPLSLYDGNARLAGIGLAA